MGGDLNRGSRVDEPDERFFRLKKKIFEDELKKNPLIGLGRVALRSHLEL